MKLVWWDRSRKVPKIKIASDVCSSEKLLTFMDFHVKFFIKKVMKK